MDHNKDQKKTEIQEKNEFWKNKKKSHDYEHASMFYMDDLVTVELVSIYGQIELDLMKHH